MYLRVKKLSREAKLPTKGSVEAACWDVYSNEEVNLSPNERGIVHTGLSYQVPKGYEMEIRPRSGWASKGLLIMNSPGTVDSDYRGELMILVKNASPSNLRIDKGDRIAQFKLNWVTEFRIEEVKELDKSERGSKGIGSTGR